MPRTHDTPAVLLITALSCLLTGCGTAPPAAEPAVEASVRPGVNDSYREPDVGQWVERFEREGREIYDQRHEIVAAIRLHPGAAVADVGTGTGLFVPLLAEVVGPTGTVYAVDIVPDFVELVRRRNEESGRTHVRPVLCTDRSVGLDAGSVDTVFICDTYHHFEYPRSTMTTIHEALREEGELIVIDFERIVGTSSQWILDHVRAGKEVFRAEIEAIGFDLVEDVDLLEQNYMLRFSKKARGH